MKQSPPRPVSFDYLLVEDRTNMELSPPVPAPLAAPPTKPRISPFAPSHPTAYSNSPSSNVPSTHGHVHSLPPPPNYSPPSFLAGMLPSSSSSSRLMNKLPTVNPPLPTTNRRISAFSHASASSTASSRTNSGANTPSIVEPLTTHEPNRMVAAVIESEKSSTATRKKTPEEIVCDSLCELQRSHPARPTTTTTPLHEIAPSISISSCESSTVIEGGGKRKRARSRDPVSTSPPLPPPLRTSSVESGLPPREDLVEFDSNGIPKKELKQTKRAAQNRAAQRAFRERKEQHIRDLQETVAKIPQLEQIMQDLQTRIEQLERDKSDWEIEKRDYLLKNDKNSDSGSSIQGGGEQRCDCQRLLERGRETSGDKERDGD